MITLALKCWSIIMTLERFLEFCLRFSIFNEYIRKLYWNIKISIISKFFQHEQKSRNNFLKRKKKCQKKRAKLFFRRQLLVKNKSFLHYYQHYQTKNNQSDNANILDKEKTCTPNSGAELCRQVLLKNHSLSSPI